MRVIAIGDIHGCINPFNELLEKLSLSKTDKLILLGDYIDRGPDSKAVLDKIIDLIANGFDVTPLLGNHETMMLRSIDSTRYYNMWILNGGLKTLQSFKCSHSINIPNEYKTFISDMPYYVKHDNYFFAHAGINLNAENPLSDTEAMLWIRKNEYKKELLKGNIIIHGHTPISLSELTKSMESQHKVINIDTGCVFNQREGLGYLSAYCVKTSELFYVQNK